MKTVSLIYIIYNSYMYIYILIQNQALTDRYSNTQLFKEYIKVHQVPTDKSLLHLGLALRFCTPVTDTDCDSQILANNVCFVLLLSDCLFTILSGYNTI